MTPEQMRELATLLSSKFHSQATYSLRYTDNRRVWAKRLRDAAKAELATRREMTAIQKKIAAAHWRIL